MKTILTNEWLNAELNEKWKDREVLCRFADGHLETAVWNGMYWKYPKKHPKKDVRISNGSKITHFYIFEKFNENDVL